MDEEIFNLAELAKYLNLPLPTAYKLVRERDKQANPIPGQKTGKQWRFMRSQIDQWMAGSASITVRNYRGDASPSEERKTRSGGQTRSVSAPVMVGNFSSADDEVPLETDINSLGKRTRGAPTPMMMENFSSAGDDWSVWLTGAQIALLKAGWIDDSHELLERVADGKGDKIAATLGLTPATFEYILGKIRS